MEKSEKIKAFSALYDLIEYYYENRDLPNSNFDFFKEVEKNCAVLGLDLAEFVHEFKLDQHYL